MWRLLRRLGPFASVFLVLLLVAGVALAIYVLLKPVTGTISTRAFEVTITSAQVDLGDCTVALPEGGPDWLDVTWEYAQPGDVCWVQVYFDASADNENDAVLTGFNTLLSPPGEHVIGTLGTYCGTTLVPGDGTAVVLYLTISADAPLNQTWSFDSGTGFTWSPSPADYSGCQ